MEQQKMLRVGFDLDGVLLYNPARIARPVIAWIKSIFFKKNLHTFHYPKTRFQQLIWFILHKSSLFPADGIETIKKFARSRKIQAYVISARYDSLKSDFTYWMKKMRVHDSFAGSYHNDSDEQPHLFKERMIKKLNLDIFVEDNWDIVRYLRSKVESRKSKIFWIYNILDRNIPYAYKFPSLKKVAEELQKLIHE